MAEAQRTERSESRPGHRGTAPVLPADVACAPTRTHVTHHGAVRGLVDAPVFQRSCLCTGRDTACSARRDRYRSCVSAHATHNMSVLIFFQRREGRHLDDGGRGVRHGADGRREGRLRDGGGRGVRRRHHLLPLQTAYGRRDGRGRLMVPVIDHQGTVSQRRPQQQKLCL